ncbi:MAG TPA: hypothetical protein PLQ55_05375, partial [Bacilli bacterium]|nr:hypothetical protein [Bacilli bacterium]
MKKHRYLVLALLSLVLLGSCKGDGSESGKTSEPQVSTTSTVGSEEGERTITWYGTDDIVITIG